VTVTFTTLIAETFYIGDQWPRWLILYNDQTTVWRKGDSWQNCR